VIEIKLANVVKPLYDFEHGGIEKDIRLLQSIPDGKKRYLILVDEAERVDPNHIHVKPYLDSASASKITIVSNNHRLIGAS